MSCIPFLHVMYLQSIYVILSEVAHFYCYKLLLWTIQDNFSGSQRLMEIVLPFLSVHTTVTVLIHEPCMASFCHMYSTIHVSYIDRCLACFTLSKDATVTMPLHAPSMNGHLSSLSYVVVRLFMLLYLSMSHLWTICGSTHWLLLPLWIPGESTDRQGQAGVYPCSCCLEWWSMNTGWHIVGTAWDMLYTNWIWKLKIVGLPGHLES